MSLAEYTLLIESVAVGDGRGYVATVPGLPGCMSDGATRELASRNVEDAVAAWIEEAKALGRALPARSRHRLSARD